MGALWVIMKIDFFFRASVSLLGVFSDQGQLKYYEDVRTPMLCIQFENFIDPRIFDC